MLPDTFKAQIAALEPYDIPDVVTKRALSDPVHRVQ
jgi:hypothetical protein